LQPSLLLKLLERPNTELAANHRAIIGATEQVWRGGCSLFSLNILLFGSIGINPWISA
jgi:hypothetical protein